MGKEQRGFAARRWLERTFLAGRRRQRNAQEAEAWLSARAAELASANPVLTHALQFTAVQPSELWFAVGL